MPNIQVILSIASLSEATLGYAFKGRRYAQLQLKLGSLKNNTAIVYLDIGYRMSLINCKFLQKYTLTTTIQIMPTPITIRGLGEKQYNANQFTILNFYLPIDSHLVAHFKQEIYIVNRLEVNALLRIDITVPKGQNINLDV